MASVKSQAEQILADDLKSAGYPAIVGHRFHPDRLWKFDLAWPGIALAVEIDGRGRHQREKGEREDQQKINAAIELRWRVLRYPARSVTTHKRRARIVEQIKRCICGVECPDSASCVLVGD